MRVQFTSTLNVFGVAIGLSSRVNRKTESDHRDDRDRVEIKLTHNIPSPSKNIL